jgi:segregation and condensation protein B
MARRPRSREGLDVELADLPPELRWREWMGRAEAVIFASPDPVSRETLSRVVGRDCPIEALIEDIRDELRGRPYELVSVAGGFSMRTKKSFAEAIRAATGLGTDVRPLLSPSEGMVLMSIAYLQPVTRFELGLFLGREISRDLVASLRAQNFIGAGPRSPRPGAPIPMSRRKRFWRILASTPCAICPSLRPPDKAARAKRPLTRPNEQSRIDKGAREGAIDE